MMHRLEASQAIAEIPRDVYADEHEDARLHLHGLLRTTDAGRSEVDVAARGFPADEQDRVRAVLDDTDFSPLPRMVVDGREIVLIPGQSMRAALLVADSEG